MHEWLRALDFYPGRQVRALDFIRADRVRIPQQAGNFFSYASFLCYDFHVIRWGLIRDSILFSRKWLCVIINDELLENGECYLALLLSIICLRRLCIACRNILTLCQLPQGVDSSDQWLEYWIFSWTDWVQIPNRREIFSAMLYSFLTIFMSCLGDCGR